MCICRVMYMYIFISKAMYISLNVKHFSDKFGETLDETLVSDFHFLINSIFSRGLWNGRKNSDERLASLGIMGDLLKDFLNPLGPSQHSVVLRGLGGALNWAPIMPRNVSFKHVFFEAAGELFLCYRCRGTFFFIRDYMK